VVHNVLFPFPPEENTTSYSVENFNYAAFADATYEVTDDFSVLGGLRYTVYDYDLSNMDVAAGTSTRETFDKGFLTWRLGGQYHINSETMVYATVSRSVKSPVVDAPPADDPTAEALLIDAEVPTNYELGAKLTAFDSRLALDLNAFYTQVEDYQGEVCTYGDSGNLTCGQTNIDEVVSKGIEIDIFGQPMAGVTLSSGYIFNPVEYPSGSIETLIDEQMMNTVKHKFTFAAEYEKHVSEKLLGFIGFDTVYKSDKRLNTELLESSVYPGHWMTGARIGVRDMGDKWNMYIFGRNLGDEPEVTWRSPASAGDTGSITSIILTPKSFRQIGVSFNMNF
jgi:iron complex outermembrane receptor protein